MKKIIGILSVFFVALLFAGAYYLDTLAEQKVFIVSTKEVVSVNKIIGIEYAQRERHLIARVLRQNAGETNNQWFFYDSHVSQEITGDTILKDVLFERSDASVDGDPLTHGDIEIRLAVVVK